MSFLQLFIYFATKLFGKLKGTWQIQWLQDPIFGMVVRICLLLLSGLLSDNLSELFSADEVSQETSESDLKYTVLGVELRELELGASGDLDKRP